MADLTVLINEKITLDGNDRGILTTQTISNINNVDNRILNMSFLCLLNNLMLLLKKKL